jgi:hypothetical protein
MEKKYGFCLELSRQKPLNLEIPGTGYLLFFFLAAFFLEVFFLAAAFFLAAILFHPLSTPFEGSNCLGSSQE